MYVNLDIGHQSHIELAFKIGTLGVISIVNKLYKKYCHQNCNTNHQKCQEIHLLTLLDLLQDLSYTQKND